MCQCRYCVLFIKRTASGSFNVESAPTDAKPVKSMHERIYYCQFAVSLVAYNYYKALNFYLSNLILFCIAKNYVMNGI